MKELKPEQIEDIRHIIDTGDKDAATQELADMHPAEFA